MSLFLRFWRLRRLFLWCLAGFTTAIGALILVPKPVGYAASGRLAMVITLFLLTGAALVVMTHLGKRLSEARHAFAYRDAPASMKDTMRFLAEERELARRHVQPLAFGALIAFDLHVASFWPQLSVLAPVRTASLIAGVACLVLILASLTVNRSHWINLAFLLRYRKIQAARIGFKPLTAREGRRMTITPAASADIVLTETAPLHWDDLTKGGAIIFGQPGSGKSSCLASLLLPILIGYKGNELATAGVIHDVKDNYLEFTRAVCRELGREKDLYVLDATRMPGPDDMRYNPLATRRSALELSASLITLAKFTGVEVAESFWIDLAKTLLMHGIVILRGAAPDDDPPCLYDLYRLAMEPVGAEPGPFLSILFEVLAARYPDPAALPADLAEAINYIQQQHRKMPEKQLAGVQSTVAQCLSDLIAEPLRTIMSGPSTITMDELFDQGGILLVRCPEADGIRKSTALNALVKMDAQISVRQRVNKPRGSWSFIDEFQQFYVASRDGTGDATFISLSRQSNHCNCLFIQNLSSLYMKTTNKHDVNNLLSCAAVKIFLRNTDPETNDWASRIIGERHEITVSKSEHARIDDPFKRNVTHYSLGARTERVVPQSAFTELEVPVAHDPTRHYTQSIIHLATRGETQHRIAYWKLRPL